MIVAAFGLLEIEVQHNVLLDFVFVSDHMQSWRHVWLTRMFAYGLQK